MILIFIGSLILSIIIFSIILKPNKNNISNNTNIQKEKNPLFENYITNNYLMTYTELKFYKELKKITDKLELNIFPQIDLERLIKVKNNNFSDRNKIKSRSIDFAIANNKDCKIICCIELDDYTHNYYNAIKTDNFKNELFYNVGIPLHRIKVQNSYNLDEIENIIKEDITSSTLSTN